MESPVPIRYFSLPLLGSAAAMGALVLGLGACSDEPDRDESGAITEGGDADVFQIEVGDCLSEQAAATGEVSEVPVVPCEEPHDSEVYFSYTVPDADTFPGDFQEHVDAQCIPQFQTFVGVPYESSGLSLTWLEPTAESWDAGDRELLCIVADPAGGVTGTLEGAAR
jgi:Septum formation